MIWGETNRRAVWSGSATQYAKLLDAAYEALKPIPLLDPDVVVGGMTFTYGETRPAAWISEMKLPGEEPPRLDEYGHNPFTNRCPDGVQGPDPLDSGARDINDLDTLREDVRSAFDAYKPLWLSEYTLATAPNTAFTRFVDEGTQADRLARAYRIASSASGVSGLGWFELRDRPQSGLASGLLRADLTRKPSYGAYKAASMSTTGVPGPCPAPAPPPPAPPTSPPPPVLPLPDRVGPKITLAVKPRIRLKALLKRFAFKVGCDEPCRITARLLIDKKTAARIGLKRRPRSAVEIGKASKVLPAAGKAGLRARISAKTKRKLRRVRRATLTLRLKATDNAGNVTRKSKKIRLTR